MCKLVVVVVVVVVVAVVVVFVEYVVIQDSWMLVLLICWFRCYCWE